VRSDGTPVSIDDVYFTYKNIIVDNQRLLPTLNTYSDVTIEKTSDIGLTVTFPKRSIDNKLFFSYSIVPRHILMERDFDYYKTDFAQKPIYTKCAQLRTQSNDINSLIFDLGKCEDNYIGFYQIKNLHSFDTFKQDYQLTNRSIVDAYYGDESLE
jgi:hypothetical protein